MTDTPKENSPATVPSSDSLTPFQLEILQSVIQGSTRLAEDTVIVGDACYPVKKGVVRFRNDDGYNSSFAKQWKAFQLNQYDDFNKTQLTRNRYLKETGWPDAGLEGEFVLEAGCGAGRFTRLLGATGANLVSFDYSTAVEVSRAQNSHFINVVFAQADVLDMPFRENSFDRVFCHGVIQHTPNPEAAFHALNKVLKPGGKLSFDVYYKDGKVRPWKSKYIWRPITTRMDPDRLMRLLEWYIPKWLPFDTFIKRIPFFGNYLGSVIPCWNYYWTNLSPADQKKWAVMDTFDALAPAYDLPATRADVIGWFKSAGYTSFEVHEGGTGLVGNGIKPPKE